MISFLALQVLVYQHFTSSFLYLQFAVIFFTNAKNICRMLFKLKINLGLPPNTKVKIELDRTTDAFFFDGARR